MRVNVHSVEDYMSRICKLRVGRATVVGLLAILAFIFVASSAFAQSDANPKSDLFVGYQWLNPGATVPTPFGDPTAPSGFKIPAEAKGFGASWTYNFDPHWGLEFDLGHNWGNGNYEATGSVGPRFIWRTDDANYFLHALVSYNRVAVSGLDANNGIGAILGGGLDLPIKKWMAFRLFEADYVWTRHNYADFAAPEFPSLRRPTFEGARLRTGLVFNFGGAPAVAPAASCTVQPTEVLVGEPLTASVTASNFNPKHTVAYSWSGNGGTVTGKDTSASIDTNGAAPGNYTVTAHVTDARMKTNNEASCSASYTIKPLPPKNPPTMSCSASSSTVNIGDTATLNCTCTSPDGVPVSVANWTSTSGNVSGSGSSATLNTAGASPGAATVTATCTDARGLTGQASTQLALQNPPPPPMSEEVKAIEARLGLGHSVYFPTAQPPVKDPNAGLLKSQQTTLVRLADDFGKYVQAKPDAHLILQGHADIRGTVAYNQALSERRVARVKAFLVEHGVAADHIDTEALGDQHNLTTEEVKESVDQNPELTSEERARVMRNINTIKLASNRRVDISLSTTGQMSKRQYPFNATDSLTLIGGRTAERKAAPVHKKAPPKK
jgi:outer membrane protein OmpA-like peptidoglycan-associated protein